MSLFASYVILYSITAGAYVALFPTVLVELFGVQHFVSVNRLLYMLRGFWYTGWHARGWSFDSEQIRVWSPFQGRIQAPIACSSEAFWQLQHLAACGFALKRCSSLTVDGRDS